MPQEPLDPRPVTRQRWRLLREIDRLLDRPMTVLAFVWLALLILDFTRGLTPWLQTLSHAIWIVFVVHFALEFVVAPRKLVYLRRHGLTALALVLPAFRVLRVFRALRALRLARAARSLGLLRLLTSMNRAMSATRRVAGRFGVGYLFALTVLATFAAAAGMYAFENPQALVDAGYGDLAAQGVGLKSYGESVWWTAMMMTTMASEYWPKTPEGRFLALLLAIYAFAIFGYITATIATLFIGQDRRAAETRAPSDGVREELAALRAAIEALRTEVARERER